MRQDKKMEKTKIEQSFINVKKDIKRLERSMIVFGVIFMFVVASFACLTVLMIKILSFLGMS